jgi:hypothetical protein
MSKSGDNNNNNNSSNNTLESTRSRSVSRPKAINENQFVKDFNQSLLAEYLKKSILIKFVD